MMELPQDITVDELRSFVRYNERRKRDEKAADKLKDKIKRVLGPVLTRGVPAVFEDVEVKFSVQNRFDEAAFAKAHPADKFPELYSMQLNLEAIPEVLKRPRFFMPVQVMTASMVEVAEVVMSDIAEEPARLEAVSA